MRGGDAAETSRIPQKSREPFASKLYVSRKSLNVNLPKCASGIAGLDEITEEDCLWGVQRLSAGKYGSRGKTLFVLEFLIRGATQHGQPGVFLAFEETTEDLIRNVASLGFDLRKLIEQKKISVQHVHVDRSEIHETGRIRSGSALSVLILRLNRSVPNALCWTRLEVLLGALSDKTMLRSEIQRLFRWLKEKGVTAVITAERGEKSFTTRWSGRIYLRLRDLPGTSYR